MIHARDRRTSKKAADASHQLIVCQAQPLESAAAVLGVAPDELEPRLHSGQRRRPDVDAEHGPEPGVFADALMNHVLVDASSSGIPWARPNREIGVGELAPHAQDLEPFGLIALDEERVAHGPIVNRQSAFVNAARALLQDRGRHFQSHATIADRVG